LSQVLGRDALILIDDVAVGTLHNWRMSIEGEAVRDYTMGSQDPSFLDIGNRRFPFRAESAWVDNTYADKVLAGAACTVKGRPTGTGSGKKEYILTNAKLLTWEIGPQQTGIIVQNVTGEGRAFQSTAQA